MKIFKNNSKIFLKIKLLNYQTKQSNDNLGLFNSLTMWYYLRGQDNYSGKKVDFLCLKNFFVRNKGVEKK